MPTNRAGGTSPDLLDDGVLVETDFCFVEISRNRRMLEARWLIPDPAKKSFEEAYWAPSAAQIGDVRARSWQVARGSE